MAKVSDKLTVMKMEITGNLISELKCTWTGPFHLVNKSFKYICRIASGQSISGN